MFDSHNNLYSYTMFLVFAFRYALTWHNRMGRKVSVITLLLSITRKYLYITASSISYAEIIPKRRN